MARLTRLEHVIMDALWNHGSASIREIWESLPAGKRPAYTTVQTMVNRLEAKKAVRRVKKVGNAFIFEALVTRTAAQKQSVADLLRLFGGRAQPIMAQLIDSAADVARRSEGATRADRRTWPGGDRLSCCRRPRTTGARLSAGFSDTEGRCL